MSAKTKTDKEAPALELTERQKKILRAVVDSYVSTAEPVGSKAIAAQPDLPFSSATIRNELAYLTEQGLFTELPENKVTMISYALMLLWLGIICVLDPGELGYRDEEEDAVVLSERIEEIILGKSPITQFVAKSSRIKRTSYFNLKSSQCSSACIQSSFIACVKNIFASISIERSVSLTVTKTAVGLSPISSRFILYQPYHIFPKC